MKLTFPRILFFLAGPVPTATEMDASERFGPNVVYRNASVVPDEVNPGSIEKCDGVAGAVPKAYAKLPKGETAIDAFMREREQRRFDFQAASAPRSPAGTDAKAGDETRTPAQPQGAGNPFANGPTDIARAAQAAGWPINAKPPGG